MKAEIESSHGVFIPMEVIISADIDTVVRSISQEYVVGDADRDLEESKLDARENPGLAMND
jgi:hypothetical protein